MARSGRRKTCLGLRLRLEWFRVWGFGFRGLGTLKIYGLGVRFRALGCRIPSTLKIRDNPGLLAASRPVYSLRIRFDAWHLNEDPERLKPDA